MTTMISASSATTGKAGTQGKTVRFSDRVYNSILAVIRDSSEPLTAAEIHYAVRENYGVTTRYLGIRQALSLLLEDGRVIRREESDRERQIRTTEVRGPNSYYFGISGYPIPMRTRGELPTDPNRNQQVNDWHKRKAAKKKAAKKARPAKASAVQTGNPQITVLKSRIAELEAQNALLMRIIERIA